MRPNHDYSHEARGKQLRRSLSKAGVLDLTGATGGTLLVGRDRADVRFTADDSLRVRLAVPAPQNGWQALELTGRLPGNVRMAWDRQEAVVLADTQIDGELHLTESFRQIRAGMLRASSQAPEREVAGSPEAVTPDVVDGAIRSLALNDESLVKHEEGWELRTRLAGDVVPVRLSIEQLDLVVRHRLSGLECAPTEADRSPATAHHALCLNARLRHARLALRDGQFVVETRLHRRLVSAHWLRTASTAVASAARYALPTLRILSDQRPVQELYYRWLQGGAGFQPACIAKN